MEKFRGIGDDEIPLALIFDHGAHPSERVGVSEFHARAVEVGVALRHGDGGLVEIDSGDVFRATESGRDGETARVAAEIEHGFLTSELAEQRAVVALVAEKARFVTVGEIDFVADAIFENFHALKILRKRVIERGDSLNFREFGIDADDGALRAESLVERGNPGIEALPSSERGDLERKYVGEFIHDEAREKIRVAVDAAIRVGSLVELKHVAAQLARALDGVEEKRLVERIFEAMVDHAQRHTRFGVVEAPAELRSFRAEDLDERAGGGVARGFFDHTRPDGRVEIQVFEMDGRHDATVARDGEECKAKFV